MLIKESDFAVVHWAPFFLLKLCYTSQTYSNTSEQAAQYSQIMHENGLFSHRVVSEVGEKVLPSHLLCWNSLWPWDEYFNDEKHKFNYIDLFPLCTFYCTCSILHWRSKKKCQLLIFNINLRHLVTLRDISTLFWEWFLSHIPRGLFFFVGIAQVMSKYANVRRCSSALIIV